MRLLNRHIITLICCALPVAVGSCARSPGADSPEVAAALRSLNKLRTASRVGASREQCSGLVIEAQSSVNDALKRLPEGELRRELRAAMEAYSDASTAWAKFGGSITLNPNDDPAVKTLQQKYQVKSMTWGEVFPKQKEVKPDKVFEEGGMLEMVSRTAMLNAIWHEAEMRLDRAESLSKG